MLSVTTKAGTRRVYEWEDYRRRLSQRKPYLGDVDLNGKTLVVRHTWGIGDLLYSTCALRGLKEKFPDVKIRYICSNPEVLENNPDIDKVHSWMEFDDVLDIGEGESKDWYWLDYDVPIKGGYDYKIHLRTKPQFNEFLMKLFSKPPEELQGQEKEFVKQASSSVITRYKMIALDMYCLHAYVKPRKMTVYYYPYEKELSWARDLLSPIRSRGLKPIVLIPNSSSPYKDYGLNSWAKVVDSCPKNYFWLVLGSAQRNKGFWSKISNVSDLAGAFRFRQSAALVVESDLCCSSDTGLLYVKAARCGPCVVVYGPHEPEPFLHYFPSAVGLRIDKLIHTPGMKGLCSTGCFIDTCSCREDMRLPPPCLAELEPKTVVDSIVRIIGA